MVPDFIVFSKPNCPWCNRAKEVLQHHRASFEERTVDAAGVEEYLRERGIANSSAVKTFPQVVDVHRGKLVGGCFALVGYLDRLVEPLLADAGPRRFAPFPIKYQDVWDMYKRAVASFWTAEEINLAEDVKHWREVLTEDERHFVKHVLAFFAGSDGIVMENLNMNFGVEVQVAEARQFYAYQTFNEAIHSEVYALLIDALIEDPAEREDLFYAIQRLPAVRKKALWAMKWLEGSRCFAERLLAYACVEGILFSGSFCAIFWLKQRNLMPGLGTSNQFISRDEGMHQEFGVLLYSHLRHKLAADKVEEIVREAVDNEKEFIVDAIPCRLVGMNSDLMSQYIEFVADRLVVSLGYPAIYGSANPFPWMELLSLAAKDNFFERFPTEYQNAACANTLSKDADAHTFCLDAAF